jgi:hypothetical protein
MADPEIPPAFERFLKRLRFLMAKDRELREAHEEIKADGSELHMKIWKPDLAAPTSDDEDFLRIKPRNWQRNRLRI